MDQGAGLFGIRMRGGKLGTSTLLRFYGRCVAAATLKQTPKTIGIDQTERRSPQGWAGVGFSIGTTCCPTDYYFTHVHSAGGAFMSTGISAMLQGGAVGVPITT